jgi:hypothetical protein
MSIVFIPTLTQAGKEAAINADNDGIELKLTHVSFGLGHYNPTGFETELDDEVFVGPITGGARVSPTQLRFSCAWSSESDANTYPIGEVGIWANDLLFAIWSKADGSVIGEKSPGVDFILFNDLALSQVPDNSVNILVDDQSSAALAALSVHEGADNAHPQYVRHDAFPDAQKGLWAKTVGGTADAIALTMQDNVVVSAYKAGQVFTFKAAFTNEDEVTVAVNGLAATEVLKNGSTQLELGDIVEGAVYSVIHDGTSFHITGGVGSGGVRLHKYPFIATEGQKVFPAAYSFGSVLVFINGREIGEDAYDATNGASVILETGASAGDEVLIVAFVMSNSGFGATVPLVAGSMIRRNNDNTDWEAIHAPRCRYYFMGQN